MPLCPVHTNSEMKQGKWGYYCTQFVGVGAPGANDKGYCNQTVKAPRPAPAPANPSPAPAPAAINPVEYRMRALEVVSRYTSDLDEAISLAKVKVLPYLRGEQ